MFSCVGPMFSRLHDSFECINQESTAGNPCPGQNGGSIFHACNNLGKDGLQCFNDLQL